MTGLLGNLLGLGALLVPAPAPVQGDVCAFNGINVGNGNNVAVIVNRDADGNMNDVDQVVDDNDITTFVDCSLDDHSEVRQ